MSRQTSQLMDEQANRRTEKHKQTDQENVGRRAPLGSGELSSQEVIDSPSFTASESLLYLDKQQSRARGGFTKWQTVIWREWSHCKDEVYANYLFALIKATAFGWKFVVTVALLGTLLGTLVGYLLGSMFASEGIFIGPWDLSGLPPVILAITMAFAGGTIGVEGSRRFRALYFWWQGQPSATRVEKALQQAVAHLPGAEYVWAEPLRRLAQYKEQQKPDQLVDKLHSPDWIDRFVARSALVAMGGEVTEVLQEIASDKTNPLWETGIWLLTNIEQETRNSFAWRVDDTLCPHCLTRFAARPVEVGLGIPITYYGCRICGQSREYLYLPQGVVAVLDASWGKVQAEEDGLLLQVNWLIHRTLFDFDWITIIQATDEDVERFAVQVGNDTDPFRKPRYQQIPCRVKPACRLSENTMRILDRMFGQVEREEIA